MPFNCFCAAGGNALSDEPAAPRTSRARPLSASSASSPRTARAGRRIHRNGSAGSTLSTSSAVSNESIARLPPCKRPSDPKIEAMMMPEPRDARPSRCLRLSHPKTYSALVADMKACKGTRDWRNFAVFYNDDVDESISAVDRAREKARDYERKLQQLNCSFDSASDTDRSPSLDVPE